MSHAFAGDQLENLRGAESTRSWKLGLGVPRPANMPMDGGGKVVQVFLPAPAHHDGDGPYRRGEGG
jgi:hypothetical protein